MKQKCTCGNALPVTCPRCSVLKMCIMLKHGQDHLKNSSQSGAKFNPVWFSAIKYNRLPLQKIKDKMVNAFLKQPKYSNSANCLLFYTNNNGISTFYEKHNL